MVFFRWNDSFVVHHDRMDEQHRQFLEALNRLYSDIQGDKGPDALKPTLELLAEYAERHFAAEETLLRTAGYPGLEEQEKQHAFFRSQVAVLRRTFQGASGVDLQSTLQFMRDWFLHHIMEVDRGYANYLKTATESLNTTA